MIRPEQFGLDDEIEVLGLVPPEIVEETSIAPPSGASADPTEALVKGISALFGAVYDNRMIIRNAVLIVGGAYVAVKGPPIVAKSFADTMHYLRDGWHGRGYETREK